MGRSTFALSVASVNLAVVFLVELGALVALGFAGWKIGAGPVRVLLAILLPVAAAVLWGLFAAPRRRFQVPAARPVVKVLVLGGAAVALFALAPLAVAVVFAAVALLSTVLAAVLPRTDLAGRG